MTEVASRAGFRRLAAERCPVCDGDLVSGCKTQSSWSPLAFLHRASHTSSQLSQGGASVAWERLRGSEVGLGLGERSYPDHAEPPGRRSHADLSPVLRHDDFRGQLRSLAAGRAEERPPVLRLLVRRPLTSIARRPSPVVSGRGQGLLSCL